MNKVLIFLVVLSCIQIIFGQSPAATISATTSRSPYPDKPCPNRVSQSSTVSITATASFSSSVSISSTPSPSPQVPICPPYNYTKDTIQVRFQGLCCPTESLSYDANNTLGFPRGLTIEDEDTIVNVDYEINNLLECSPDVTCDISKIVYRLSLLWNKYPCAASKLFSPGANLQFWFGENYNYCDNTFDFSNPSDLSEWFNLVKFEFINILTSSVDQERLTAVVVGQIQLQFDQSELNGTNSGSNQGTTSCALGGDDGVDLNGNVVVWGSVIYSFNKSCRIDSITIIPSRKYVLTSYIDQIYNRPLCFSEIDCEECPPKPNCD